MNVPCDCPPGADGAGIPCEACGECFRCRCRCQDDYEREALDEWVTCSRCDGRGEVSTCCDDICQEECIHGDGMETCPDCDGEGEVRTGAA